MNPYLWPWRAMTENVVIYVTALVVAYDILAMIFGGENATVSRVMSDAGRRWPIVVGAGVGLVAHWWWPSR